MRKRLVSDRRGPPFLRAAALLGLFAACALAETPTSKYQLFATGSDAQFWAIVGQLSAKDKTFNNWFSYVDRNSFDLHTLPGPLGPAGRIARVAAAAGCVYVFYDDGSATHYRFSTSRDARRELRLPDEVVPDAIAADPSATVPELWALVRSSTADAIGTQWERTMRLRTTQPAAQTAPTPGPTTQPTIGERPSGRYHVVRYTGADWQPELAVPVIPIPSARVWLAVANGSYYFLWQRTREDSRIFMSWRQKAQWATEPVVLDMGAAPAEISVGVVPVGSGNRQLLLSTLLPERGRERLQARAYMCPMPPSPGASGKWSEIPPLRSSDGQPLILPLGSAIGSSGDRIGIVRAGQSPEVGFWSVRGGAPDRAFRSIPLRRGAANPEANPRRDIWIAVTLVAVLLLVFWRRQASFGVAAVLPSGFAIAMLGRRFVAAVVDLLPALIVVNIFWSQEIRTAIDEFAVANDPAQFEDAVLVPALVMRLVYVAWCMCFELIWSRTPGKWFTGCAVISESLSRPRWYQIVLRNATRMVELEPYPPIALPLLLLVLITRNRQRAGDLLARTLVIQRTLRLDATVDDESQ